MHHVVNQSRASCPTLDAEQALHQALADMRRRGGLIEQKF
jgi:hypothetical protein